MPLVFLVIEGIFVLFLIIFLNVSKCDFKGLER